MQPRSPIAKQRLTVQRETLRTLQHDQLRGVQGGSFTTTVITVLCPTFAAGGAAGQARPTC